LKKTYKCKAKKGIIIASKYDFRSHEMPYIKTFDRDQMMYCSWDSFVKQQSLARIIDAFVNSLDLAALDVKEAANEGRPAYDPRGLFKLYIYGNRKGIRSSRKLQESCETNLEVKWMMGGVEPDFRTIADFRKDNIASLKKVFKEFNKRIAGAVEWGYTSIDGSKFMASNSKDRNFTKNKLDDRIKWLNAHTEEYLRILDEIDASEELDIEEEITRDNISAKLEEARARLARYEEYQRLMEEEGLSQLSLTDTDSRLMKSRNGFVVAYNPQTAVDSNTHLIRDFKMTNQCTDHGLLEPTLREIKSENPDMVLETVADKGYEQEKDMLNCLEHGIIPHVIMEDGKDGYEFETGYVEAEADTESTKPEEIGKAIHSGQIPEVYKNNVQDMRVKQVRRFIPDAKEEKVESVYGTVEEMKERAAEGYFVRDPERNLVICPAGEILRQKSIKNNGNIRYANKTACRHCQYRNKCYKGKNEWKEIDFTKDKLEKPCREWIKSEDGNIPKRERKKGHYEIRKVVRFFFKPSREKMSHRLCLSEHPFGTIKRAMGATHFLLKGLEKVEGEFALFCLGYNIERAKNLLGFDRLMKLVTTV
jgi:transposase